MGHLNKQLGHTVEEELPCYLTTCGLLRVVLDAHLDVVVGHEDGKTAQVVTSAGGSAIPLVQ
jgi:hypothetical protein